jgi:hypothetical protein
VQWLFAGSSRVPSLFECRRITRKFSSFRPNLKLAARSAFSSAPLDYLNALCTKAFRIALFAQSSTVRLLRAACTLAFVLTAPARVSCRTRYCVARSSHVSPPRVSSHPPSCSSHSTVSSPTLSIHRLGCIRLPVTLLIPSRAVQTQNPHLRYLLASDTANRPYLLRPFKGHKPRMPFNVLSHCYRPDPLTHHLGSYSRMHRLTTTGPSTVTLFTSVFAKLFDTGSF